MNKKKSVEDLLEEISKKLDIMITTFAIQGENTEQQIKILTNLGLTSQEIGNILGLNPGSIRNIRSGSNKRDRSEKRTRKIKV